MFCKYCGQELKDDAVFCGNCGKRVSAEEAVPEYQEPAPVYQEPTPEYQEPAPVYQEAAPVYQEPVPAYQEPVTEPKKKKGKGVLTGIIIAVVALAVIAAAAFMLFKDQLSDVFVRFSSPEAQQLYTYKKLAEKTADNYGDAIVKTDEEYSGKGELAVALGDSAKSLISAAGIDVSGMESVNLAYDANVSADITSLDLALSYNGESLITADAVVDLKNKVMTLSVPELNDKALKLDLSDYMAEMDESLNINVSDIVSKLPDQELFEGLLKKYLEIALKELQGVTKEAADLTVGDITVKSNLLTTEFTEKMLGEAAVKVMEAVKEDEDIKQQFINFCELAGEDGEESYKDFIVGIEESLASADVAELTDEVVFTLKTWVDSSFDILAVEVTAEDGVLFLGSVENNEALAAELSFESDDTESFKVTFDGTNKRNVYDGDIAVYFEGENMLNIACEGIDTEADSFVGKMTLTSSYLGEAMGNELASMAEITLEGKTEGNKNTVVIGVGASGSQLGTLTLTSEPHEFTAPKLHTDTVDDAETWAASINTESLMTKLTETGLMDIVSSVMMGSIGGYDDEYYDDEYYDDYYEDYTDYDYGYDAGYTDGYFDSAWGDEYGTCYGDSAEDDTDEYMQGYEAGYDDGYNDGLEEAAA